MLTEQPSAPMQSAAMTPTTSPDSSVITKLDEILVRVGVRDRVRARARARVRVSVQLLQQLLSLAQLPCESDGR